jgi:hypothetical protein
VIRMSYHRSWLSSRTAYFPLNHLSKLFSCEIYPEQLIRIRSEQLLAGKHAIQQQLDTHPSTLDDLDELGEIMTEMLHRQETVEVSMMFLVAVFVSIRQQ